ncbi:MAG: hypothetical protein ACYC3E_00050 [Carboxydocellales bacterium]
MIYLGDFKAGEIVMYWLAFNNDAGSAENPTSPFANRIAPDGTLTALPAPTQQNAITGLYGGTVNTTGFANGIHAIHAGGTVTTAKTPHAVITFRIIANTEKDVIDSVAALQADLGDPSAESVTILSKVKDLDKGSGTIARTLSSMGADYIAKLNSVALAGVTVKAYLKTDLTHIKGQITTDAAGDGTLYLSSVSGTAYVLYYEYQGSVLTKEYTVP